MPLGIVKIRLTRLSDAFLIPSLSLSLPNSRRPLKESHFLAAEGMLSHV